MAASLLLHYKADGSLHAASLNEQGKVLDPPVILSIEELAELYPDAKATLLIDSTLIHSTRIALPDTHRQRLLKAAPYALEDQLACDIDDVHFTLGKRESDNLIPVVCINKALLKKILAQFNQATIHITAICPDLLALPLAEHQWTLLLDEQTAYIKLSAQSGYFCERENLPLILPSLLQQSATPPQTLLIVTQTDTDNETINNLFAGTDLPRITQHYSQSLLHVFATHLQDARSMNLLQGDLAIKSDSSVQWRIWRIAAFAAAGWLVIKLLVAGLEIQMLNQINQQLTVNIESEFKRIFPDAKKFSGMQSRVKNRLKQLRGGDDESNEIFLQMLAEAAPALTTEGLIIRNIAYRERHIDLELQANSLQILETAKSKLDTQRTIKAVLSTSVEKDKVSARLRLEPVMEKAEATQG